MGLFGSTKRIAGKLFSSRDPVRDIIRKAGDAAERALLGSGRQNPPQPEDPSRRPIPPLPDLAEEMRRQREEISRDFREKWRREEAERRAEELYGDKDVDPTSELGRFLDGEMTYTPNSSNVHSFQWYREDHALVVNFGGWNNSHYGLRPYTYFGIDMDMAKMFFEARDGAKPEEEWGSENTPPWESPGVAVWQEFRGKGQAMFSGGPYQKGHFKHEDNSGKWTNLTKSTISKLEKETGMTPPKWY